MTSEVDRQRLADLLEQVRNGDDTEALAAARQAQAVLDEAGATWHDVLVAPVAEADEDDEIVFNADDGEDEEKGTMVAANDGAKGSTDNAEALRLIERMLAQAKDDEAFREELNGYKDDIAADEFDARDRQYVRDLFERLRQG